ncbi:MAG: heavy-metal-associated domain-containing protein [Gammaproteobacteria bacterium]
MSNVIHLSIPGMKCGGCVTAIEKALDNESDVIQASVDLEKKRARVETSATPAVLIDAIKTAGFDATELPGDDQELSA